VVSICQEVLSSPQWYVCTDKLEPFQIDRLTRLFDTQKLLRRREILGRKQNLISSCITFVCKKKVSLQNLSRPLAAKLIHIKCALTSTITYSHKEPASGQACNPHNSVFFCSVVEEFCLRYQCDLFIECAVYSLCSTFSPPWSINS